MHDPKIPVRARLCFGRRLISRLTDKQFEFEAGSFGGQINLQANSYPGEARPRDTI